jgi:hypothetical protein
MITLYLESKPPIFSFENFADFNTLFSGSIEKLNEVLKSVFSKFVSLKIALLKLEI